MPAANVAMLNADGSAKVNANGEWVVTDGTGQGGGCGGEPPGPCEACACCTAGRICALQGAPTSSHNITGNVNVTITTGGGTPDEDTGTGSYSGPWPGNCNGYQTPDFDVIFSVSGTARWAAVYDSVAAGSAPTPAAQVEVFRNAGFPADTRFRATHRASGSGTYWAISPNQFWAATSGGNVGSVPNIDIIANGSTAGPCAASGNVYLRTFDPRAPQLGFSEATISYSISSDLRLCPSDDAPASGESGGCAGCNHDDLVPA